MANSSISTLVAVANIWYHFFSFRLVSAVACFLYIFRFCLWFQWTSTDSNKSPVTNYKLYPVHIAWYLNGPFERYSTQKHTQTYLPNSLHTIINIWHNDALSCLLTHFLYGQKTIYSLRSRFSLLKFNIIKAQAEQKKSIC